MDDVIRQIEALPAHVVSGWEWECSCDGDACVHDSEDDVPISRSAVLAALRIPPVSGDEPGIDDERFVRLATAVMQLRDFLALHRTATGRSDVNIRKVLRLLDDALLDDPDARPSHLPETPG